MGTHGNTGGGGDLFGQSGEGAAGWLTTVWSHERCFYCCCVNTQVLYGATDLLSGEEFLHQLEELGRRSGISTSTVGSSSAGAAGAPAGAGGLL